LLSFQILNAPWNTTKTFIEAMKGSCLMDDGTIADPTGVGLGFSYVRVLRRQVNVGALIQTCIKIVFIQFRAFKVPKPPRKKIIGTKADLRKLTLPECKDLCRELGVKEEQLSILSR
jgi:hypothetical protein